MPKLLNDTHMVIFGDREHFANLAYLTGFDPRFEESLLQRRAFMTDVLGIDLPDEVLPLSNTCAIVPPFFLSPIP